MIIRFVRYHLLLTSNSTFMTDFHYLDTIQIWRNLNEHYYYLTSTKSLICQIDANCSHSIHAKTLKTNLLRFNIKFF